jgi:hypothetical protein
MSNDVKHTQKNTKFFKADNKSLTMSEGIKVIKGKKFRIVAKNDVIDLVDTGLGGCKWIPYIVEDEETGQKYGAVFNENDEFLFMVNIDYMDRLEQVISELKRLKDTISE